ncbi:MAG TPA: PfkB family carbohydrate kinase [Solirubrobacterales bacterium]
MKPRVTVFAPNPLLAITIERRGEHDDVHLHAAGQGVWLIRMAAELGAEPILCGFRGGETGTMLEPLLERMPGERRLVATESASGCYVVDRRSGEREAVAQALSEPVSRHELDDLFATTVTTALGSRVLAVCNPFPAGTVPRDVYGKLVADVRAGGVPVLVDLSSPRLESALDGGPDLVKLNDWELAEFVYGPVSEPRDLRAAAERLRAGGAETVVVTRGGEPAFVLDSEGPWELVPPRFEHGTREGCGDSMMGGVAAALATGGDLRSALRQGAAAGAVNFLRHGLGTGSRASVEELVPRIRLERLSS